MLKRWHSQRGSSILWLPLVMITSLFALLAYFEISREYTALYVEAIKRDKEAQKEIIERRSISVENLTPICQKTVENSTLCSGFSYGIWEDEETVNNSNVIIPRINWNFLLQESTVCEKECTVKLPLPEFSAYQGSIEENSILCTLEECTLIITGDLIILESLQITKSLTIIAAGNITLENIIPLTSGNSTITLISTQGKVEIHALQGAIEGKVISYFSPLIPDSFLPYYLKEEDLSDLEIPYLVGIRSVFPTSIFKN